MQAHSHTQYTQSCTHIPYTCPHRYSPGPSWQHVFVKRLQVKLEQLRTMNIADILWSAEEMGMALPPPVLGRMAAVLTGDVSVIPSASLPRVLLAMVRLGMAPSPQWLQLFVSEVEYQMRELSLGALADAACALAHAGHRPSAGWLGQLRVSLAM